MLLRILCLAPLLFQCMTSQAFDRESAGCKYRVYVDKKVNAHEFWQINDVGSFDACVEECARHNANAQKSQLKCDGVMYTNSSKHCIKCGQLSPQGEGNFTDQKGTDTAIIKSCKEPARQKRQADSSNFGCGLQDSDYLPSLDNNVRIINAGKAKPHSWPWMLRLCNDVMWSFCGATLVPVRDDLDQSDIAMTAAHCLFDRKDIDQHSLFVHAGKHELYTLEEGELPEKVVDIKFVSDTLPPLQNDVALMRLENPIRFTKTIRPVCLPNQYDFLPFNKPCFATGWGRNNSDDKIEISTLLKQAKMDVRTDLDCFLGWQYSYVFPNQFCAGNGFDTTCQGDSGGPFVCQEPDGRWTQYGITSYVGGQGTCIDPIRPAAFARVSTYANWIKNTIQQMSKL